MTSSIPHGRVSLDTVQHHVPAFLARASTIHDAMSAASSTFTAPVPTMPVLLALIQAAMAAQQASTTRTRGLASVRDGKVALLASALASERAYVQGLVDASPEQGAEIAASAGMRLVIAKRASKPLLALSLGEPSGIVRASAHAALLKQGRGVQRATTYNWRFTPDGGKTWLSSPSTPSASTVLTGLTPLTTYGVQVCITDAAGTTAWTDTATIIVH